MKRTKRSIKILVAVTFLVMIIANILANILPINGVTTGQVSDSYPNLFAPAGITFAIWGLIYLLLACYTLYQLGFFQNDIVAAKAYLLENIGIYFSISSIANAVWIFSWHYHLIPVSMLLMAVILVCLIFINKHINNEWLSTKEKVFIRIPFSVYFGWITVAAIANAVVLLVSLGWYGLGISEPAWAVILISIGVLIGIATIIKNKDNAYGLVFIWAYSGILIKHTSASGFSGQYPAVIITVIACIVLLVIAVAYNLFSVSRGRGC